MLPRDVRHVSSWTRLAQTALLVAVPAILLSACGRDEESEVAEVRPVRTVTVEKREAATSITFTGRIESMDEAALGFRISGRMIERPAGVGDSVEAGEVVARLEPQNEMNALRAAQADLAAAQARLTQARNQYERQSTLLGQGWTTRALYDQAEKARSTAQAQVDAAEAQLKSAHDLVSFTEIVADAPGVVTATGAEPGEVVQAGQMIVRLSRQGGRDAVFDIPAQALRSISGDAVIAVHLTNDPTVESRGRIREVAPAADPVTRTFEVKVGLDHPPEAMRLGATVTGTTQADAVQAIQIPASALTKANHQPAVWIVDPTSRTVSLRNIDVARFDPATVTVSQGLDTGEIVVTAGVQALHPGQKIRVLGLEP